MRVSGEEWEYANPPEAPRDQKTRGVKDRDRREMPGEDDRRVPLPLQPLPEAPAESKMKGVKVVLRKIPLQVGK